MTGNVTGATAGKDSRPVRVLVAKLGLDGHDRGAKVVVRILRDAGMEVIYTGLRRTASQVISAAVDEDVDVIGLSILSGAHIALVEQVLIERAAADAVDIAIVVGGTISTTDAEVLKKMGAAAIFPVRSTVEDLVDGVRSVAAART